VLVHFLLATGIQVDLAKVKVIMHFLVPKTLIQVCSLIGCTGYYRRFIEKISKIAFPLFQLLTKDAKFLWTDDCEVAFEKIKELIFQAPILRGPN